MRKGLLEIALVAVPKALGGAGLLAINLLLLRYLGREEYGIYTFCLAGILLSDAVFGSALDFGVLRLSPLYRGSHPARSLEIEQFALAAKVCAGGGICLLVFLAADPLARFLFQVGGHGGLIRISAVASFFMLLLRSVLVHAQVDRRFVLYGALDLLHFFLKFGGIALVILLAEVTPARLLVLFAAGPAVAFVAGLAVVGRALLAGIRFHREAGEELFRFTKWFLVTFSLAALISRVDIFLLPRLSSLEELGVFSAGFAFASIPELMGTYLSVVLGPRIMPYYRDGRFHAFFRRVQSVCILGAAGLFLLAWAGFELGAGAWLPDRFSRASTIILVLLPGALAGMAVFPLTISFLMFVRPRFLFHMDLVTFPVMLVCYVYAIRAHGALGAAWVTSLSRLAKSTIAQIAAWRLAAQSPGSSGVGLNPETAGV